MDVSIKISKENHPASDAELSSLRASFEKVLDELHGDNVAARTHYSNQYPISRLQAMTQEDPALLLIASTGSAFVGFGIGRVSGGVGFIHWMGVESAYRGSGIGRMIATTFIEEFESRGCHKVELYTYQERPKLQKFYESLGFQTACKLDDHYFHLDVLYMTKSLTK